MNHPRSEDLVLTALAAVPGGRRRQCLWVTARKYSVFDVDQSRLRAFG